MYYTVWCNHPASVRLQTYLFEFNAWVLSTPVCCQVGIKLHWGALISNYYFSLNLIFYHWPTILLRLEKSSFTLGFDNSHPTQASIHCSYATAQHATKSCQGLLCTVLCDSNPEAGGELCSQKVGLCSKLKGVAAGLKLWLASGFRLIMVAVMLSQIHWNVFPLRTKLSETQNTCINWWPKRSIYLLTSWLGFK